MIKELFQSSRQRGRLALGTPDGYTLSSGQHLSVRVEGPFWIPGSIESDGTDYLHIPDVGGWAARITLRAGMVVQIPDESAQNEQGA